MDGKPRSTFGCPSVWRLPDVYGESETSSTQHRRLRLLRSSKTGEGERKFTESSFLFDFFLSLRQYNIYDSDKCNHDYWIKI